MNGNFKTLIAIAATPLLLLSCSDEVKLTTESEGENLVSLTVQLPEELGTRAFGEASKIKSLKYAVYPQGEQQPLAMFDGKAAETVEMTGLSKNVQLQLASGKKYDGVSRFLVGINFRHPNVMPNFAVWKTITYRLWHRWCCQPRF